MSATPQNPPAAGNPPAEITLQTLAASLASITTALEALKPKEAPACAATADRPAAPATPPTQLSQPLTAEQVKQLVKDTLADVTMREALKVQLQAILPASAFAQQPAIPPPPPAKKDFATLVKEKFAEVKDKAKAITLAMQADPEAYKTFRTEGKLAHFEF